MTITEDSIETLLKDPEEAASMANLIYLKEHQLSIFRKKHGKGFIYYRKDKKISDRKEIERFKSLVIPPAWRDVKIAHHKNGHLQVIGLDEKSRKQYRYHPKWSDLRNQTKFYKMIAFGEQLPKIRKRVDKDLDLPKMTRRKVLALVVRLMEETHIRIGNDYYAKKNKTYGLSTLRTRHVITSKNKMKFEFVGKKGKEHSVSIRNKKLIKLVNQCEEIPGWELFKFFDEYGEKQVVDSGMINEYIHEISGDIFSAKDFRTWAASKIFFETLHEVGHVPEEKENKKNIITALDAAATGLGNTRTVCRSYYVHPYLMKSYEEGDIVNHFKKIKEEKSKDYSSLSCSEKVMLNIFREHATK
ncbi:DNA topoisomerase IB [Gillisia sp. M10.2A]|uniref:DNA topoisomerase n=1 Tax=Gillisia lutea TaxID=2909668 RepID=A0ABS9EIV8_9FLAO|nr:DNA topoisomerase IB [Gillisia lutea]MCF4102761.1 DNA topoisomerase IB [Gillisia lutea]